MIIFLLAGAAIACSVAVAQTCHFFEMENSDDAPSEALPRPWNETPPDETIQIGIFGYERDDTDGECRRYEFNFEPAGDVDAVVYLAQYAAVLAPSFGFVGWMGSAAECIFWFTTKPTNCCYHGYVIAAACLGVAGCCQLLTFFLFMQSGFCSFDSSQECALAEGAILAIIAASLYWLCAAILICIPRNYACCSRRQYFSKKQKERKEEQKIREELQERGFPQSLRAESNMDENDASSVSQWSDTEEETEHVAAQQRQPQEPVKSKRKKKAKSRKKKPTTTRKTHLSQTA